MYNAILLYLVIYFMFVTSSPEVAIRGQFCKTIQNGTMVFYNLDRNGIFVLPKLTNLWKKILLKYGFLVQSAIVMSRGIYLLPLIFKIGQILFVQNDRKKTKTLVFI